MELVGVIVIVEKGQQLLRQKASNEKSNEEKKFRPHGLPEKIKKNI
jgi:hypothetical protein